MVHLLGESDKLTSVFVHADFPQMVVATVLVVFFVTGHTIRSVVRSKQEAAIEEKIEQTRRELAAYVAEGSMTADEAERLLQAGRPKSEASKKRGCC